MKNLFLSKANVPVIANVSLLGHCEVVIGGRGNLAVSPNTKNKIATVVPHSAGLPRDDGNSAAIEISFYVIVYDS